MDDHNHDTWTDLQAFKSRQNSLREKLQRRKKEREDILANSTIVITTDKVKSSITASGDSNNGFTSSRPSKSGSVNFVHAAIATVAHDHHKSAFAGNGGATNCVFQKGRLSSLVDNVAMTTTTTTASSGSRSLSNSIESEIVDNAVSTTAATTTATIINGNVNSSNAKPIKVSINDRLSSVTLIEIERRLLQCLCDAALKLPIDSRLLLTGIRKWINLDKSDHSLVVNLLEKFAHQALIQVIQESMTSDGETCVVVSSADHSKLIEFAQQSIDEHPDQVGDSLMKGSFKRSIDAASSAEKLNKLVKFQSPINSSASHSIVVDEVNVESLLSLESTRERESKKMGEELLELLSKPTVKERSLVERFRSVGGGQVQEFCAHGTKGECVKQSAHQSPCERLHFKKIIQKHTDETLGDCSFLSTCFHMDSCKYVHYKVDYSTVKSKALTQPTRKEVLTTQRFKSVLYPPQWLQCDLRFFDMTILGKFAVVMADPPWDIHMELPYGTLSDDEMRKLNIPSLQDEGLIFLWVTGRAMELGRECLKLWGYERCDEIIWVKTNQLQRIIRTGRTGHWLNHGKEHCLVGIKGQPKDINRGLDCDVIVAEVRATSHKPDEIYGIIERMSPGTKKIELFGRPHNVQPNWITLGNQLDGVRLIDPELIEAFKKRYQDGNCMTVQA